MKIQPKIFHVSIETPYVSNDVAIDEFNELQKIYKDFDFIKLLPFDDNAIYSRSLIEKENLVLSFEQIADLAIKNIKVNVLQEIKINVDITKQLIELAEKPIKLIQENSNGATYNSKCEVHMPGHALSLYNEMLLKEDCCTDEIQSELNSGWRIISVCPQPDQRRPDYILGRFNPEMSNGGSAHR